MLGGARRVPVGRNASHITRRWRIESKRFTRVISCVVVGVCIVCEFKNCPGRQACLLKSSSPCPGDAPDLELEGLVADTAAKLGLRGRGFLDQDELISVLGIEDPIRTRDSSAEIVRITEFRRAS